MDETADTLLANWLGEEVYLPLLAGLRSALEPKLAKVDVEELRRAAAEKWARVLPVASAYDPTLAAHIEHAILPRIQSESPLDSTFLLLFFFNPAARKMLF